MPVEQGQPLLTCEAACEPVEGNLFVSVYPPFSCWTAKAVEHMAGVLYHPLREAPRSPLGVYLHIPICADRCHYCYYRSYAHPSAEAIDRYVESLLQEAARYARCPAVAGRRAEFAYGGCRVNAPTV